MSNEKILLQSMRLPSREAWTLIVSSIFGLFCLLIDEIHLGFGAVSVLGLSIMVALMLITGIVNLLPEQFFLYGVEIKDDGFVFHHQLRRAKFIRYKSIYRIVASSMIDGDGESACTLRVKSFDGNARLEEHILYGTGILDALKSLPGFDNVAWSRSDVPDDSLLRSTIPKKTVILEKKVPK